MDRGEARAHPGAPFRSTRRQLLGAMLALGAFPGAGEAAMRRIPQRPSARVVVDNDFAGDPDGLIALAHQLLTPKTRTVLVTTTPLKPDLMDPRLHGRSAARAQQLAVDLCRRLALAQPPPVIAGSESFGRGGASEAARSIVAEAMRDDPLPLYVTCGGPLTNIAAALRLEPAIARRMTVVWIGGGSYPAGGWEYNLATDLDAARHVIHGSAVPLWQVPEAVYRQVQLSIAELDVRFRPISPVTAWLYEKFTHPPDFVDLGGAWPMGDSPLVLLTALTAESSASVLQPARAVNDDCSYGASVEGRQIRVFERLDARLVIEDFLALMHSRSR